MATFSNDPTVLVPGLLEDVRVLETQQLSGSLPLSSGSLAANPPAGEAWARVHDSAGGVSLQVRYNRGGQIFSGSVALTTG